jgi:short-subunit dehydrogenase
MISEDIQRRNVWITGASSGIGSMLAEQFARNGDTVIASARTESTLNDVQKRMTAFDAKLDIAVCDVRSELSVMNASKQILSTYNHIDILINNAGISSFKNFITTTVQEFDDIISTNLRGIFLTTQALLPTMLQRRNGIIMNILSFIVKRVYTKSSIYSASKAGVEAMMNVLRDEVRHSGIKIVNVYPGAVATSMWRPGQLEKYHTQMLSPQAVSEMVYQISCQPPAMMVEEVTLRPQNGDLSD